MVCARLPDSTHLQNIQDFFFVATTRGLDYIRHYHRCPTLFESLCSLLPGTAPFLSFWVTQQAVHCPCHCTANVWRTFSFHLSSRVVSLTSCSCQFPRSFRCFFFFLKQDEDHIGEKGLNLLSRYNLVLIPIPYASSTENTRSESRRGTSWIKCQHGN